MVIGLDFTDVAPADPAAQILGNAVFLASRTPVRILDYRELTTWNSSTISNTVDLIADEAIARGRDVTTTVVPQSTSVPDDLRRPAASTCSSCTAWKQRLSQRSAARRRVE